jgi:hypothetical protein
MTVNWWIPTAAGVALAGIIYSFTGTAAANMTADAADLPDSAIPLVASCYETKDVCCPAWCACYKKHGNTTECSKVWDGCRQGQCSTSGWTECSGRCG